MIDSRAMKLAERPLFDALIYRCGIAAGLLSLGVLLIVIAGIQSERSATYPAFAQQTLSTSQEYAPLAEMASEKIETPQSHAEKPFALVLRPAFSGNGKQTVTPASQRHARNQSAVIPD